VTPIAARAKRLWDKYGITLADYDRMLTAQGGGCAICEHPPKPGKNLAVDHDHAMVPRKKAARTPQAMRKTVRGLLCWVCNHKRLGRGATAYLLHRASVYLEAPPARMVL